MNDLASTINRSKRHPEPAAGGTATPSSAESSDDHERIPKPNAATEGKYSVREGQDSASATKLSSVRHSQLLNILTMIQSAATANGLNECYPRRRIKWLQIQLELNRRLQIAPGFRPGPVPTKLVAAKDETARDMLSRDRQYVDLDWVARRRIMIYPDDSRYRQLIFCGNLDRGLAEQFVCESWKSASKADILGLPAFVQHELMTLRSTAVKDRVRYARSAVNRTVVPILNQAAHARKLDQSEIPLYADLDLARRLADGSSQEIIAELLGLIRGEAPMSTRDIKASIRKLNRWLESTNRPAPVA